MRSILPSIALACLAAAPASGAQQPALLDHAIVREADPGPAAQITTAELREILARGGAVVLDARPAEEFGMSHIPGAVNVSQKPATPISRYVSDVAEVKRLIPDRDRVLVLYCNGPFCGKSRRLAGELVEAGYRNVRRYQLGMPGWRASGGVAAIEASAVRRVAALDRTAVFIDAGLTHGAGPVERMVRLAPDQVTQAKDDGRLPMYDHNTRIIVLAATAGQARAVAEAIAANAFHNVAYYDGDGSVLRQGPLTESRSPDDALRARETALRARDADALLRSFADDAIVVTPSGRLLIGKDQIRVWTQDQVQRGQREKAGSRHVQATSSHGPAAWPARTGNGSVSRRWR